MSSERPRDNPFLVLDLPAEATPMEMERAGQKLLGMLAVGAKSAQSYVTPWGMRARDEEAVRAAVATLRDPSQRLQAVLWLDRDSEGASAAADAAGAPGDDAVDAFRAVGWRGPCPSSR